MSYLNKGLHVWKTVWFSTFRNIFSPCKLWLIHPGMLPKQQYSMGLGQATLPCPLNLCFFTWTYNFTVLECFHFFKYKIYRQYYNFTCFCTQLHAFPDQPFYSILVKSSIYAKLCAVRRLLRQALGSTEQAAFPNYVFWNAGKFRASNKTLWKRMHRSCPECLLIN